MSCTGQGQSLSDYLESQRWEHRMVITFDSSLNTKSVLEQQQIRALFPEDWEDRDLFLLCLSHTGGVDQHGDAVSRELANAFFQYYSVRDGGFTVILVGKDGGEKLRREGQILDRTLLFETIDQMPMRQQEMREP